MGHETAISPRLAAVRWAVEGGDRDAVRVFWDDVARRGTPLLEPDPDGNNDDGADGARMLVTLLWRAGDDTRNVAVLGGFKPYQPIRKVPKHAHSGCISLPDDFPDRLYGEIANNQLR